jgi:hypothetical protein
MSSFMLSISAVVMSHISAEPEFDDVARNSLKMNRVVDLFQVLPVLNCFCLK